MVLISAGIVAGMLSFPGGPEACRIGQDAVKHTTPQHGAAEELNDKITAARIAGWTVETELAVLATIIAQAGTMDRAMRAAGVVAECLDGEIINRTGG